MRQNISVENFSKVFNVKSLVCLEKSSIELIIAQLLWDESTISFYATEWNKKQVLSFLDKFVTLLCRLVSLLYQIFDNNFYSF